jgi:hypothetical protein
MSSDSSSQKWSAPHSPLPCGRQNLHPDFEFHSSVLGSECCSTFQVVEGMGSQQILLFLVAELHLLSCLIISFKVFLEIKKRNKIILANQSLQ